MKSYEHERRVPPEASNDETTVAELEKQIRKLEEEIEKYLKEARLQSAINYALNGGSGSTAIWYSVNSELDAKREAIKNLQEKVQEIQQKGEI